MYKRNAGIQTRNMASSAKDDNATVMEKQRQFVEQTAGKIQVDEEAIKAFRATQINKPEGK